MALQHMTNGDTLVNMHAVPLSSACCQLLCLSSSIG